MMRGENSALYAKTAALIFGAVLEQMCQNE
jgi:hypothetical protein